MDRMPNITTINTPKPKFVFRKPHNPIMSEAFKKALSFSGSVRGPVGAPQNEHPARSALYRKIERAVHTF